MGFKIKAELKSAVQSKLGNLTSGKLTNIIGPKSGVMQQSMFPYDLLNSPNYRSGVVFTAYNLDSRTRDQMYANRDSILKGSAKSIGNIFKNKINQTALANIFLPPQKTVVEQHNFSYSEGKDGWLTTLQQKGFGGVVGSSVYGIIEDLTGGYMQETYGEAVDKRTKLMFNDAEPRQLIYLNTFTFRNINDLIAFAEIYFLFTYLAYPSLSNSGGKMGDKVREIVNNMKSKVDDFLGKGVGDNQAILNGLEAITDFQVIKVPPVWKIQTFTKHSTQLSAGNMKVNAGNILPSSTFGPAVITSIRFNKTPNSVFNTFRAFPNDPISVEMEITFKELFALRNSQIFDQVN